METTTHFIEFIVERRRKSDCKTISRIPNASCVASGQVTAPPTWQETVEVEDDDVQVSSR